MKTMILAAFLGFSTIIFSQERKDNSEIEKELNLSAEQTEKLKEIHEQFKPDFKKIMMDKGLTRDEKSTRLQELRSKEREASKSILSKEQIARFNELEQKKG